VEDRELESAGESIERLLQSLGSLPDGRAREWAEQLVQVVTELYGEGMRRVMAVAGPEVVGKLAGDDLVGGLLVLHGLHPTSLQRRIEGALGGIDGVESVEADESTGAVEVRLVEAGSALEKKVRAAIENSVPDALQVAVDGPVPGSPVRFVSRKDAGATA
jgi:hypothetical protein